MVTCWSIKLIDQFEIRLAHFHEHGESDQTDLYVLLMLLSVVT